MDESATGTGRDRRVALWLTAGLLVLLGAGYAGAHALTSGSLPYGTTIGGVDVGRLTPAAAVAVLEQELDDRTAGDITVAAEGRRRDINPADMGLSVDYEASVSQVGLSGWDPASMWSYLFGDHTYELVTDVDTDALSAEIGSFAAEVDSPAVDGTVSFRGTRVRTTPAVVGRGIDVEEAVRVIADGYPRLDDVVALPVVVLEPDISNEDVRRTVRRSANKAVSAPVVVIVRDRDVKLRPGVFARALSYRAVDGDLVLTADPEKLATLLGAKLRRIDLAPVDATVRIVDGRPTVIPGKPGLSIDSDELAVAFVGAAVSQGRTVVASTTKTPPSFTTADAKALKIRRVVSSFTTYYPHAEYRNVNIGRAAELINGTVLKPGDVFSLNGIVGERTAENGFTKGYIISDGVFKEDYGGGVSQSATTTFNAAFFAGLKDIEHKPHSLYISRYPVGREATVAWPSVDLRFENDTPHGILVQAWIVPSTPSSQGSITVRMWSKKYWVIRSSQSARYNYTDPGVRYIDSPDCEPFGGQRGFEIDVYRSFYRPGSDELHHKETFHTRYLPGDKVVCGKPPTNQR